MVMIRKTLPVVSSARKLVFIVPPSTQCAEFPEGVLPHEYGQNNERPAIVVVNRTTDPPQYQGADCHEGIVIVNEVPEGIATCILRLLGPHFSVEQLDGALGLLGEVGCGDQYTSDREFLASHLSPAGMQAGYTAGIYKRDDRDVAELTMEGGIFYVAIGGSPKQIEPDILKRTYRNVDGTPINLDVVRDALAS